MFSIMQYKPGTNQPTKQDTNESFMTAECVEALGLRAGDIFTLNEPKTTMTHLLGVKAETAHLLSSPIAEWWFQTRSVYGTVMKLDFFF